MRKRAFRWRNSHGHHSRDINVIGDSETVLAKILQDELSRFAGAAARPTYLDVGGRKGERANFAEGYDYHAMDIKPGTEEVVVGDICACPEIAGSSYDVVASFDVFEHLERPWDAARECIRILKPGGLLVHWTLFAYRYHPIPIDYWRFSAQGLEYLFCQDGNVDTLVSGYDLRHRRQNSRGVPMKNNRDVPPIDFWGGFRENWRVVYVGRKRADAAA